MKLSQCTITDLEIPTQHGNQSLLFAYQFSNFTFNQVYRTLNNTNVFCILYGRANWISNETLYCVPVVYTCLHVIILLFYSQAKICVHDYVSIIENKHYCVKYTFI